MATVEQAPLDMEKLEAFVFRAVDEVGATLNTALVVMGDRLGLYRALAGAGPLTPTELADRTGTAERYVREWLNEQAAGGYVEYDPESGRYTLPPEQALALTDSEARRTCPGFFQIALGSVIDSPRITEAAETGEGVGWHEHNHDVFEGCERFFRPGYNANLLASWLPALDGVVDKLERGASVADVGCGHGIVDDPDGEGVPELDVHRLRLPRRLDRDRTASGRARPASATRALRGRPRGGYQRCKVRLRHDVRLPARHGRPRGRRPPRPRALAPDGTWMIVEPRGRRPCRGQPEPGRPRLLRVLDAALHAGVAVPGGRARARRPGGRGAHP